MTIVEPVAELLRNVSTPFAQARAMPPSVYTSPEFLQREIADVFAKEWFSAGRASALSKPGDYVTLELAGQPLFVMRDSTGQLRAMSNVCLHRMSTLLEGAGNRGRIVCPYHGWTYNLDGTLRAAPAMNQNACFDRADYRLPQVRCEEWLGWIMVTLNPNAPPVAAQLAEVQGLIDDYGMEDYVETFRETHVWDTNWKILAENFMESYHLPVCHAGTIGGLSRLDEMVCPPGRPAFNFHTILKDDKLKIALAHPSNTRMQGDRRRTTFLLAIYPSLLITLTPGYFWYLSLHPRGGWPGRHHLRRRHVAGIHQLARGTDATGAAEDAVGQGQRRGSRLHRAGVQWPVGECRQGRALEPPGAAELRLCAVSRREDRRLRQEVRGCDAVISYVG